MAPRDRWLEGQVALITGGAAGIGAAVAKAFIDEGARVGVLDRSAEALEDLGKALGDDVLAIQGDVTSWEDNARAVQETVAAFGPLDTFVGNAAIGDRNTPIVEIEPDKIMRAFHELYAVNVGACLLGVRAALDQLLAARGSVILTGSISSFNPGGGGVLYVSSKHAVVGLVRQLAYELAPKVRVNGVAPGVADTRMLGLSTLEHEPGARSVIPGVEQHIPLGFVPETADHTGPFVLLASKDRGRAITGSIYASDSGFAIKGLVRTSGGADL